MRFEETKLFGAWLIEPLPARDHPGFFARTFCAQEYAGHGLTTRFVQHNTSQSVAKGTLRGMDFQHASHGEVTVVGCLKGVIWDVIIGLRPESPTHRRWLGVELTAANRRQLYVPEGFAHGFQALCDDTEVGYLISQLPPAPGDDPPRVRCDTSETPTSSPFLDAQFCQRQQSGFDCVAIYASRWKP